MANEITYQVMGTDPVGNLNVKFSMGDQFLEFGLPWHGEGDLDEFIKRYTPRQQLMAMTAAASLDHSALVGKTGTADLELTTTPPATAPTP